MERWHQLFQLREQDTTEPGYGGFQLGPFFHLVETVSGE